MASKGPSARKVPGIESAYMVRRILRMRKAEEAKGTPVETIQELLKQERHQLSEDFHCSVSQVRAFTAHGEHIRPERARKGAYTKRDKRFATDYVSLSRTPDERERHVQEVVEMLDLPAELIRELTKEVKSEVERLFPLLPSDKQRMLDVICEDHLDDNVRKRTGEHISYETVSKHAHRDCVETLISQFASRERLAMMQMMCMPNEECGQIPWLLRAGLQKKNIWGIEGGDRRARSEFMYHARLIGLEHAIPQRFEDFLPSCKIRFNIVEKDYLGPVTTSNVKDMGNLLLAERALVITNTMAKRERWIKEQLEQLWKRIVDTIKRRHNLLQRTSKTPVPDLDPATLEYSLGDARELSPLLLSVGRNRKEKWPFVDRFAALPILPQHEHIENDRDRLELGLSTTLSPLLEEITTLLNATRCFDRDNVDDQIAVHNAQSMFSDVAFGNAHLSDIKKFSYQSDASQQRSKFFIDAAIVHTPLSLYERIVPAVEFLLQCTERRLALMQENEDDVRAGSRLGFCVVGKGGFPIDPRDAKRTDTIACRLDDDEYVAGIQLFRLENALREYHNELTKKVDAVRLFAMRSEPRISLTKANGDH